jgi:Icc-related predicted phosphoesterase
VVCQASPSHKIPMAGAHKNREIHPVAENQGSRERESTKLAFATDIHRDKRIFPWLRMAAQAYDIVAIGGDIDDPYPGVPHFKFNYAMHKLRPDVTRDGIFEFASGVRKPVLVVLGNHDNRDSRALHGRSVGAGQLIVGGVGGSLPSGRFPFQVEESEYESILSRLGHVDVLIVHQPPHGTKCDISYAGEHVGSRAVREYVVRERPRLVLTGHVHESPAVDRLGGSTILNPGPFFTGSYGAVEVTPRDVLASIVGVRSDKTRDDST